MMKNPLFKRILSLSAMILFLMGGGINSSLNAQRSDGFFKGGNDDAYNNRGEINNDITLGGVTNNENPTEAPLGSGLLIMVAAGVGYAVARRKNAVRKGMTMLVALGLMLGMTQCKKDTVTPVSTDNKINITLNANYGGEKTTFDPSGSFAWNTSGIEYINVGGKVSGYLGQLTNEGHEGTSDFSGSIETPAAGETMLYFFYLGNGNHAEATTLDFSNQSTGTVTNWHIAIGSQAYSGQTEFNATLNMAMAIAYFDLSQFTNGSKAAETVYIHGDDVYSTARIDYNNGTIIGNSKGYINAGTAYDRKYVALIPSVETETTLDFNSSSKTGSMTFNNGIKPASYYSNDNNALTVSASDGSGIPGTFSVSATKKVFFSKGNLQYQASTGTWRFADNQYDAIGNNAGNNNFSDTRSTQSYWIDLFGWGTSGWEGGSVTLNNYYRPYDYLGTGSSNYGYYYGPSTGDKYSPTCTYSLIGDYANRDWGVYNTISNGGSGWRTLTGGTDESSEWKYLLETRNASTVAGTENARFFKTKVNNINGLVILPDVYVHPTGVTNPTNINVATNISWSSITLNYTLNEWAKIEAAGAIFLPCTGYRSYSSNNPSYTSDYGCYWSSTVYSNSNAYYLLSAGTVKTDQNNAKRLGYFVRLVKDVK